MGIIAEVLVTIYQMLFHWNDTEQSKSNKYAAFAFVLVLLLVAVLIYRNNPDVGLQNVNTTSSF